MTLLVTSPPASEPLSMAEIKVHCRIDETNQEPAPGALLAANADPAAAGNVDDGDHRYRVTFVTADGETEGGIISAAVSVSDKTVNGQVELTSIPVGGAMVTSRKIYRTAAGGSDYLLLATLANNTATNYTDNIADASLGAGAPVGNTTSDPQLGMLLAMARQAAEKELGRYLITQTVDAFFDAFPSEFKLMPIQEVTSITYIDSNGDSQTLAESQYVVDANAVPARIVPASGVTWPSTLSQINAVTVRFVAGYGSAVDVPESIRVWMLLQIKHSWENPGLMMAGSLARNPREFVNGLLDDERCYGGIK